MAANLEQLTETLISIRRNLHEHPELSYEEFGNDESYKELVGREKHYDYKF